MQPDLKKLYLEFHKVRRSLLYAGADDVAIDIVTWSVRQEIQRLTAPCASLRGVPYKNLTDVQKGDLTRLFEVHRELHVETAAQHLGLTERQAFKLFDQIATLDHCDPMLHQVHTCDHRFQTISLLEFLEMNFEGLTSCPACEAEDIEPQYEFFLKVHRWVRFV